MQYEGQCHCLNFFRSVVIVNCPSFILCVRVKLVLVPAVVGEKSVCGISVGVCVKRRFMWGVL
jgi:hypothetical protein